VKNPQVKALIKNSATPIHTRMLAGAAIVLLNLNMAMAQEPATQAQQPAAQGQQAPVPQPAQSPSAPSQQETTPQQQTLPQQTTGVLQTGPQVPFDAMLRTSHNPLDAYRGKVVSPPSLANSPRLSSLIRDGKLYLSLRNAIDLALEDNLDLVIARYNLPIAQMDILRTEAGGFVRGVNTGVVSGTPGGAAAGAGSGSGAGGTSSGAGGAGAGAGGIVQSTFGVGTNVSSYDPFIQAKVYNDHTSQLLPNQVLLGVPVYRLNENLANISFQEAFPTGTYFEADLNNNRQTSNSPNNTLNPQLYSNTVFYVGQHLLAGFGLGPNLRYLRIARTDKKISDIAFKAQIISTVSQICNIYWDLVNAYDTERVGERSVAFATETLDTSRKQLALQAIPEMDVLKAESELATRQQDLTVARTNLELQELYMKNAITRSFDDPALQEMAVVPTDHLAAQIESETTPVQQAISDALKNRWEIQQNALDLSNRELTRKTARNALLPQLDLYGFYSGTGYGGTPTPGFPGTITAPGPAVDTTKSFTVSAWVNQATLTTPTKYVTVLSQDGKVCSGFWFSYSQASGAWGFGRSASDVAVPATDEAWSKAAVPLNTWVLLTGVYDVGARTLTLYVNGVPQNTTHMSTAPYASSGSFVLGRSWYNSYPSNPFSGSVADVRVYDRALTAAEVQSLLHL